MIAGRRIAILPVVLTGLLTLTGCQKPAAPSTAVGMDYEIEPLHVGVSTIALKLTDGGGRPITGARIHLEATMTHPGMPSTLSEAQEAGAGRYQSTLEFAMAGDWIVLLRITLPDGQKLVRRINVEGVAPKS